MIQDFTFFFFLPTLQHHMSTEKKNKDKKNKVRGQNEVQDLFNPMFCFTL